MHPACSGNVAPVPLPVASRHDRSIVLNRSVVTLDYVQTQRAVLMAWKAAVADAVAKGWSREETIERVRFDDQFGPVDVGQAYMIDHIQNNNAGSLWDKLTATGYEKGR